MICSTRADQASVPGNSQPSRGSRARPGGSSPACSRVAAGRLRALSGVLVCLGLSLACSCRGDPARDEAATLVRLVTDLREAPNPAKRGPLDRLQAMKCSFPDVCEARAACADAFQHHVRGVELGARMHERPDASAPDQDDSSTLTMRLLEMNIEIEEGNQRMPLCEEKMAGIRVAHKI